MTAAPLSERVRYAWLGRAAVRIECAGSVLYVDPSDLRPKKNRPADVVLLSNPREGHVSPEDVAFLVREGTRIFGPEDALRRLGRPGTALVPGREVEVGPFRIRATAAGTRRTEFFPPERGWLGYRIETPRGTLYYAGMTDALPEGEVLAADVAFLPVSGRYVMGPEEARRAGESLGADVVMPLLLMGDRYDRRLGFRTAPGEL